MPLHLTAMPEESVTEARASLVERVASAEAKVDSLRAEQRTTAATRELARTALIQAERDGTTPAQRTKLEKALGEAETRASQRWAERIEGARQAARDAQFELQRFTAEHLTELVAQVEADGERATEKVNTAATALVEAFNEREQVAAQIAALASQAGRINPGDVSRSAAEGAAQAAAALIQRGGEVAPTLLHDPRKPQHPEVVSA
jgi:hypothetical protein